MVIKLAFKDRSRVKKFRQKKEEKSEQVKTSAKARMRNVFVFAIQETMAWVAVIATIIGSFFLVNSLGGTLIQAVVSAAVVPLTVFGVVLLVYMLFQARSGKN